MARKDEVKKLIRTIGDDPQLLNSLLRAPGREEKARILNERVTLRRDANAPALSPQEIAEEMEQILKDGGLLVHVKAPADRAVEWVGAIATAAAGAMAA